MTTARTPSAQTEKLVAAIEALLDVILDGRMDELSEKEEAAVRMADEALKEADAVSEEDPVKAVAPELLEACNYALGYIRAAEKGGEKSQTHIALENALTNAEGRAA